MITSCESNEVNIFYIYIICFRFFFSMPACIHQISIKFLELADSKLCFSHFVAIFGFFQFLLCLSEFSQVESRNFFGFFNLLLVGLNLQLQLTSQFRYCILVLLILVLLELELLDTAFRFLEGLVSVGCFALDTS